MACSESEGFPSEKKYDELLVLNDELFKEAIKKFNNKKVIELYRYILKEKDNDDCVVSSSRLDELKELMDDMTIIRYYNNDTLSTLEGDYMDDNFSSLDDTIDIMEKRKNLSLGQRILNYLR